MCGYICISAEVRRSNRTLQDRLVKERRLNKISTIKEANAFLPAFIEDYTHRFAGIPKNPINAHKPLEENLDLIFTIRDSPYLSKQLTFQYKNELYQIPTQREIYALAKTKVTIQEARDGSIEVLYKNKPLSFEAYHTQQKQGEVVDSKNLNEVIENLQRQEQKNYKPPHNHPWKRGARKWLFGGVA